MLKINYIKIYLPVVLLICVIIFNVVVAMSEYNRELGLWYAIFECALFIIVTNI